MEAGGRVSVIALWKTETMTVQQLQLNRCAFEEGKRWTASAGVNKMVFILWQFELL